MPREEFQKKACLEFRPMPTNSDVCFWWLKAVSEDGIETQYGYCHKGLECPTDGQRPERADQESDSEE